MSLLDLSMAAGKLQLRTSGFRLQYSELLEIESPAILLVSKNHFVTFVGVWEGKALVADYPRPAVALNESRLTSLWNGMALVVEKLEKPSGEEASFTGGARIHFERELGDFGIVSQGKSLHQDFQFSNVGDGPLTVEIKSTSCSCAGTVLSASEVLPGATGAVEIALRTLGKLNRVTNYVNLKTNDFLQPETTLALTGIVKVDMRYAPRMIDFGDVLLGESLSREIVLVDSSETGLEVKGFENPSGCLVLSATSFELPDISDDLNRKEVAATLDSSSLPLGVFESYFAIKTSVENHERIVIPVRANVVGGLVAEPGILFFGQISSGKGVERRVKLRHLRDVKTEALRITSPSKDLQVWLEGKNVLAWRFSCSQGSGKREGVVTIYEEGHPGEPLASIPFFAQVRNP